MNPKMEGKTWVRYWGRNLSPKLGEWHLISIPDLER